MHMKRSMLLFFRTLVVKLHCRSTLYSIPNKDYHRVSHLLIAFSMQQRIALNAGNATTHIGCIRPSNFRVSSVATGLCRAYNSTAIAASSVTGVSDQALLLLNTEHFMQRGILSGADTRASSSFMRFNIVAALAAQVHTVYFFSIHDVILECDLVNRTISRKV